MINLWLKIFDMVSWSTESSILMMSIKQMHASDTLKTSVKWTKSNTAAPKLINITILYKHHLITHILLKYVASWHRVAQQSFNSLRPRQNERHFADDIFHYISLIENIWISIKMWLKFVPRGPINNIPALVQIMAWRRPGDKPLSEPMIDSLPKYISVTRPQWVNISVFLIYI